MRGGGRSSAGAGAGAVRITVSDAGQGVPDDLVPALFEEFSRGPDAAAPGAGLGLSVVRSLARAQGGRAWYERGAAGAVFVFTLPAAAPPQSGLPDRELDRRDLDRRDLDRRDLDRRDLDAMGTAR